MTEGGRDGGDRRSAIGQHALEVLAERGLRGFTHRAVDAAAGLGPGSVNYHAPTRERLLDLAIDSLVAQEARETAQWAAAVADRPPAASVVDLLVEAVAAACEPAARHRVIARHLLAGEAQHNPRVAQRLREQRVGLVDFADVMLRHHRLATSMAEADLVIMFIEALISRQVVTQAEPLPPAAVRQATENFVAQLGIREPAQS